MIRRVQERVDLRDRHPLIRFLHLQNLVARADVTFLEDAKVKSRTSTGCQQRRHSWLVHPKANPKAGNPRLRNLEERAANSIAVPDAHRIVGQSFDCEILTELPRGAGIVEIGPLQLRRPIAIRLELINNDSPLLTAVASQIALPVSIQVQPARMTAAGHWTLPDCRVHRATVPLDVARKTHVH